MKVFANALTSLPAPAKLNLFLHITGRRTDGFHELQTVFQFLDFGDTIDLELREDGAIRREGGLPGLPEADDLVVRAARLLAAVTGCGSGVAIRVVKRIPAGGGLGGGSSDAATVLLGLDRLWGTGLATDRLAELGLRLGADVPVFVRGHAAWAEGVGERLVPVDPPEDWYLVVHPGVAVSTAEIFNAPGLTRNSPPITIRDFLSGRGGNACEPIVRERYPEVGRALDWLRERAGASRLTGTGACVFAAFSEAAAAERLLDDLPPEWRGFVTRGCNRSPLHARLEQD